MNMTSAWEHQDQLMSAGELLKVLKMPLVVLSLTTLSAILIKLILYALHTYAQ